LRRTRTAASISASPISGLAGGMKDGDTRRMLAPGDGPTGAASYVRRPIAPGTYDGLLATGPRKRHTPPADAGGVWVGLSPRWCLRSRSAAGRGAPRAARR